MADVISDLGFLFLGSRLKRLAERLQADAAKVHHALGVQAQPAELALLAALDRVGPMSNAEAVAALGVSQPGVTRTAAGLIKRGLVLAEPDPDDQRRKRLRLSDLGAELVAEAKAKPWPAIEAAVAALCQPLEGSLLDQISALERQLGDRSLESRALAAAASPALSIREWSEDLAPDFLAINAEWIESMFTLETKDREILEHPIREVIAPGGIILFAEAEDLGVVGTCALMKIAPGIYELTKMGVLAHARGRGAGDLLLRAALDRARVMEMDELYLLTNARCAAAIRLYEKHGFVHDARIMQTYGARYARCDVAMRLPGLGA